MAAGKPNDKNNTKPYIAFVNVWLVVIVVIVVVGVVELTPVQRQK